MADAIIGASGNIMEVDAYGGIAPARTLTSTQTSVAATLTNSTQLLAANPSRRGLVLYNNSTSAAFVSFGTTCRSTSGQFSLVLASSTNTTGSQNYSMLSPVVYTGKITAHWVAANGYMAITEF